MRGFNVYNYTSYYIIRNVKMSQYELDNFFVKRYRKT